MAQSRFHALAYAGMSGDFSPVTCIAAIAHATFMTSCVLSSSMRAPTASVNATHAPGDGVTPQMANPQMHMLTSCALSVCTPRSTASDSAAAASFPGRTDRSAKAHRIKLRFCRSIHRAFRAMALSSAPNAPGIGGALSNATEYSVLLTSCAPMW